MPGHAPVTYGGHATTVTTSDDSDEDTGPRACEECGEDLDPHRGMYAPEVYRICKGCYDALDDDAQSEYVDQMCDRLDDWGGED